MVLVDIRLPVMDGLEATRLLCQQDSPPAVVVLTSAPRSDLVRRASTGDVQWARPLAAGRTGSPHLR